MNIEHRTLNVQRRIMYSARREPQGLMRRSNDQFKKDRAKPPARRGCSAYASESDTTIRHLSFVNRHFFGSGLSGLGDKK